MIGKLAKNLKEYEMVFVKRTAKPEPGFNVGVILQKKPTKGLVGLEIEVEGKKLLRLEHTPPPWTYHQDGSLRGEENAEYVLGNPIEFEEVEKALTVLWDAFRARGSTLDESNRTSVHVHLNVQSFFFNRLTSFLALYFAFEEVLTAWCGDHRVGNLFCLRAKDAPAIVSQLRKFIKTDGKSPIHDHHHYAGLNAHALIKFGSLEARALRGVSDPQIILDWVAILRRLYDLSASFVDPRQICEDFSAMGPNAFFDSILGDQAETVRRGVTMTSDDIRDSLYEGIRLAQDLCYARDWSIFKEVNLQADPFGRDTRKIAKKLAAMDDFSLADMVSDQALVYDSSFDEEYNHVDPIQPFPSQGVSLNTLQNFAVQPFTVAGNGHPSLVPPAPPTTEPGWWNNGDPHNL